MILWSTISIAGPWGMERYKDLTSKVTRVMSLLLDRSKFSSILTTCSEFLIREGTWSRWEESKLHR